MSRSSTRILKTLLPVFVLGLAGLGAYTMYLNRPPVETQPPVIAAPSVRVQPVTFETVTLTVTSQGTVRPRTSSQLVPEISGPIIEVAPSFAVGGFFEAGDVLLKIDPYDYQQAVITGRSQLAQAELRLAQEQAEAEVARQEWEELGRGAPSALTLREPQVADAEAAIAAAQSALDRAIRDLERADIRAPYAGRVQSKDVDIGQFVNKGNAVGSVYAIDSAEIRLPLPDEELAYVDVPMSYRGTQQQTGPSVTLSADFAGRRHSWKGRIVRTESEIDAVSRMVHVVAEVNDPYALGDDPNRPPLAAGMFVEAQIAGRTVKDVVALPWAALRGRDQVLLVDGDGRLRFRQVSVLRSTRDRVLISAGLLEGERVCVSALDTVTDGMAVQVIDEAILTTQDDTDPTPALATSAPQTPPADVIAETNEERGLSRTRDEQTFALGPTQLSGTPPPQVSTREQQSFLEPSVAPKDTRPAANFEVDPTLSRPAQIAAIRREIERLRGMSQEATTTPSTRSLARRRPDLELLGRPAAAGPRGVDGRGSDRSQDTGQASNSSSGPRPRQRSRERGAAVEVPVTNDSLSARATPEAGPSTPAPGPTPLPPPVSRPARVDVPISVASDSLVAVLPFTNLSRNPADDIIGSEMAAVLRTALDNQEGMRVSALPITDDAEALAAATSQQIQWMVNGGYQRLGDQLRVTVRILNVPDGSMFDSFKFDGTLDQRDNLTRQLVTAVHSKLASKSAAVHRSAPFSDPPTAQADKRPTIAVAPFTNISRNPTDDRIRGTVAEAITGGLRLIEGISIVRLNDDDTGRTASSVAATETATWLVNGGYQLVGEQLRITARLVDVSSGTSVESIKIDGAVDQLPDLLAEIVLMLRTAVESSTAALSPRMVVGDTANTAP